MIRQLLIVAFLAAAAPAHAEQPDAKVVAGDARFTVIAPECIRIEYAKDGKFVDDNSMFAVERDAAWNDFKLSRDGNDVVIDTGKIRLRYHSDDKPFNPENLHAQIARGKDWVEWQPGAKNRENLGGNDPHAGRREGPGGPGRRRVAPATAGTCSMIRKPPLLTSDWVRERPENGSTDWYLFGYGTITRRR